MRPDPHKKRRSRLYRARKGSIPATCTYTATTTTVVNEIREMVEDIENTSSTTTSSSSSSTYDIADLDLVPQIEKFTIKEDQNSTFNVDDFSIASLDITAIETLSTIFTSIPLPCSLTIPYLSALAVDDDDGSSHVDFIKNSTVSCSADNDNNIGGNNGNSIGNNSGSNNSNNNNSNSNIISTISKHPKETEADFDDWFKEELLK